MSPNLEKSTVGDNDNRVVIKVAKTTIWDATDSYLVYLSAIIAKMNK